MAVSGRGENSPDQTLCAVIVTQTWPPDEDRMRRAKDIFLLFGTGPGRRYDVKSRNRIWVSGLRRRRALVRCSVTSETTMEHPTGSYCCAPARIVNSMPPVNIICAIKIMLDKMLRHYALSWTGNKQREKHILKKKCEDKNRKSTHGYR